MATAHPESSPGKQVADNLQTKTPPDFQETTTCNIFPLSNNATGFFCKWSVTGCKDIYANLTDDEERVIIMKNTLDISLTEKCYFKFELIMKKSKPSKLAKTSSVRIVFIKDASKITNLTATFHCRAIGGKSGIVKSEFVTRQLGENTNEYSSEIPSFLDSNTFTDEIIAFQFEGGIFMENLINLENIDELDSLIQCRLNLLSSARTAYIAAKYRDVEIRFPMESPTLKIHAHISRLWGFSSELDQIIAKEKDMQKQYYAKDFITINISETNFPDTRYSVFKQLVQYVYTDTVPAGFDPVELFRTAANFKVVGLKILCERKLASCIDASNAREYMNLSLKHKGAILENAAKELLMPRPVYGYLLKRRIDVDSKEPPTPEGDEGFELVHADDLK